MYLQQAGTQDISEIIKAASQSKLGVTSLVIVVLSIIGVYLFKEAYIKVRVAMFLVMFGGFIGFAIAMTRTADVIVPNGVPSPTATPSPDGLTKCIQDHTRELERHPQNASAFYDRGSCYQQRNKGDDITNAINDYNQVIAIYKSTNTERADIYQNRGNAYEARGADGDMNTAIADYTYALELTAQGKGGNSNRLDLLKDRGYAYETNGKRDLMLSDFKTICDEAPKSQQCASIKSSTK